jgi:hypothetical protein
MVKNETNKAQQFIKVGYVLFIVLAIYHLLINKNLIDCAMNLGIALVFDPFDQNVSWNNRPKWQRTWLIVHVLIALSVLIFGLLKK